MENLCFWQLPNYMVGNYIKGERIMNYKRLTINLANGKIGCLQEYTQTDLINRLVELEDKIENGTLIEVDKNLIGEGVIGIHCYMDGTFGVCLDENIVIGFGTDGVVTWNNVDKYNDYFKNGCYFIDNEKGRTQLKAKLKELKGE